MNSISVLLIMTIARVFSTRINFGKIIQLSQTSKLEIELVADIIEMGFGIGLNITFCTFFQFISHFSTLSKLVKLLLLILRLLIESDIRIKIIIRQMRRERER